MCVCMLDKVLDLVGINVVVLHVLNYSVKWGDFCVCILCVVMVWPNQSVIGPMSDLLMGVFKPCII